MILHADFLWMCNLLGALGESIKLIKNWEIFGVLI